MNDKFEKYKPETVILPLSVVLFVFKKLKGLYEASLLRFKHYRGRRD